MGYLFRFWASLLCRDIDSVNRNTDIDAEASEVEGSCLAPCTLSQTQLSRQAQFLQERADACSEEGLAIVNQFMYEKDTRLWRPALMYYAAARASELGFKELFDDLGAYVQV